jgi:hypothetical protein
MPLFLSSRKTRMLGRVTKVRASFILQVPGRKGADGNGRPNVPRFQNEKTLPA